MNDSEIVSRIDKALDERNHNVPVGGPTDLAAQEDRIFVRKCMQLLGQRD